MLFPEPLRASNDPTAFFDPCEGTAVAEAEMDAEVSSLIESFLQPGPVAEPIEDTSLAGLFADCELPEDEQEPVRYLDKLARDVVRFSNRIASPRCLGHMNQGLPYFHRPLARLVTALNQNVTKSDASRALTLCERQALAVLHRLVYDRAADFYGRHIQNTESTLGIVTAGGTVANLTALWCARNAAFGPRGDFAGIERDGVPAAYRHYGYDDAVIVGSELMHYSFDKAAGLLGFGERNLLRVPADARGRIDLKALRQTLDDCRGRNRRIVALVGLAGSTDAGSVDPLAEMADLARAAGVHFHVDAAWGGPLLFSERHRPLLAGCERADSVTIDGHKQLYLPLGIGLLLLRDPHLARSIEKQANYLSRPGSRDLGRRSLEGSRPGMVLYLHAALHILGRAGYARLIDDSLGKARQMAEQIRRRPEFELLAEPQTNVVLYRYVPPAGLRDAGAPTGEDREGLNAFNERLQKAQRQTGRTYVTRTTLNWTRCHRGEPVVALRAVVANPLTTDEDIAAVLNDQHRIATCLLSHEAVPSVA